MSLICLARMCRSSAKTVKLFNLLFICKDFHKLTLEIISRKKLPVKLPVRTQEWERGRLALKIEKML